MRLKILQLAMAVSIGLFAASSPVRADGGYIFKTIDVPGAQAGTTDVSAINNRDEVAGSYVDASGVSHGYLYLNGHYTRFDVPGATSTRLSGVNDFGQLVGTYVRGGTLHGFLDTRSGIQTTPSPFLPLAINDLGRVLGLGDITTKYYSYWNGILTPVTIKGSVITGDTSLYGLNNIGQYAGSSGGLSRQYGIIVTNGVISTTITLSGYTFVHAINDRGQAVGYYDAPASGQTYSLRNGFLYENGAATTFDEPGAGQTWLTGINDRGDIIGAGFPLPGVFGNSQAFLAVPDPPAAPEPSTWAMMALGFAGLGLMGSRGSRARPAQAG